jgi:hypothetical protein
MASKRDQENWQEDRLMISLATESGYATVTAQASSRATGKQEVILEWGQEVESLVEPGRATDHLRDERFSVLI